MLTMGQPFMCPFVSDRVRGSRPPRLPALGAPEKVPSAAWVWSASRAQTPKPPMVPAPNAQTPVADAHQALYEESSKTRID
jgi:hypothetical protein